MDERALARLRDTNGQTGALALKNLREALTYVTYADTLDRIVERAREIAAGSPRLRRQAEELVREAQGRRKSAPARAQRQD